MIALAGKLDLNPGSHGAYRSSEKPIFIDVTRVYRLDSIRYVSIRRAGARQTGGKDARLSQSDAPAARHDADAVQPGALPAAPEPVGGAAVRRTGAAAQRLQ